MEGLHELEMDIVSKQASIDALSGSLLQIAKQGISLVHRHIDSCPRGRSVVGGLYIKTIVWEGRNQSLHYETPNEITTNVEDMFHQLNKLDSTEPNYKPKEGINLSFKVVRALGWLDYDTYKRDMKILLPLS